MSQNNKSEAKVKKPVAPKASRNERGSKRGPGKKKFDHKKDQLKIDGNLRSEGYQNNPNWYFKDAVQAEIMSRIQMNAFGAITPIGSVSQPTVMAFYANPCPGVNPNYIDSSWSTQNGNLSSKSKGINRAAQKLWYILTAKSGRAAGYTKADCALLILAIGAMIETYEFIRRVFAIAYTYNQRNRALPNMLFKAMNVRMDDYQRNAAVYLKRMNSLMAIMNQLPIPGNIAWFAKCQDIFQNIYMDYPSEMAQLFIICPSTTWVIEEDDGFVGGSYLRTVDMCVDHPSTTDSLTIGYMDSGSIVNNNGTIVIPNRTGTHITKTLGDYIDVFEEQINKLLFSSSFSQIYSDILRAFDTGTLSRWSFDYIAENYNIAPIFDDNRLWMLHNATKPCGFISDDRTAWQARWTGTFTYEDVFKFGTPLNDVYQWGNEDVVVYNPTLITNVYAGSGESYLNEIDDQIIDFPVENPTVEQRIEYTRYSFMGYDSHLMNADHGQSMDRYTGMLNFNLPDHWFELTEVYRTNSDDILNYCDQMFDMSRGTSVRAAIYGYNPEADYGHLISKFHHAPTRRTLVGTAVSPRTLRTDGLYGELNAWTKLESDWFNSINDMIYVDLFDIR